MGSDKLESIAVGACAAAVVAEMGRHRSSAQDNISSSMDTLNSIGFGANETTLPIISRFVSRLRANYELTVSGIMSDMMAAKDSRASEIIAELQGVFVGREAALTTLDSIQRCGRNAV